MKQLLFLVILVLLTGCVELSDKSVAKFLESVR